MAIQTRSVLPSVASGPFPSATGLLARMHGRWTKARARAERPVEDRPPRDRLPRQDDWCSPRTMALLLGGFGL